MPLKYVSNINGKEFKLGLRCANIRRYFKENKWRIGDKYLRQLKDIGFIWSPYEFLWETMFKSWLDANKQYDGKIPRDCIASNGNNIYCWASEQRKNFKKGKLSKEQVEKLTDGGLFTKAGKSIKVSCGDEFVGEFYGTPEIINEFEKNFGVKLYGANISKVLNGHKDSYKGYKFSYVD